MKTTFFFAIIAIATLQTSCKNAAQMSSEGSLIPIDSANKMIGSYINSIDTIADQTLSFTMDAATLRDLLENDAITGLKIMLAHPLEYINAGNADVYGGLGAGKLTFVIGAYDNEGNYVYAPGGMVPNKARICPPYCITNGSAANNLFE